MSQVVEPAASIASKRDGPSRERLRFVGAFVGPIFIAVAITQMVLRPGFDLNLHPLSALSLGEFGWIQIANFLAAGAAVIIAAALFRQRMKGGLGGVWGPVFVGIFGLGLVVSGLFTADGAYGFPAGSPAGLPAEMSWHSIVHNTAAQLSFAALIIGCFVFLRRFIARREIAMAVYTALTPVAVVVSIFAPGEAGFSLRLFVGVVFLFAWLAVTSVFVSRTQPG